MSSAVSTLQDFPWEESVQAVKDSLRFDSHPAFAEHVFNTLPQNSPQTCCRYLEGSLERCSSDAEGYRQVRKIMEECRVGGK